jgi:hypothetical protein
MQADVVRGTFARWIDAEDFAREIGGRCYHTIRKGHVITILCFPVDRVRECAACSPYVGEGGYDRTLTIEGDDTYDEPGAKAGCQRCGGGGECR